ncbi:hypothetical protein VTN77DRAFT_2468 [Rasamsonia byssochlamydoides]|uniref:uncharacterized protein n=1 Tax=Rasamsonia byssochlamydoides TaxID=89139 RepID=UPI003744522C
MVMSLSEIATQLLVHSIQKIFILGRSKKKFSDALEYWRSRGYIDDAREDDDESRLCFVQCDLADIRSVKESADRIVKATDRLDVVICNAGLGISKQYKLSPQGIEATFATDVVGHQVLVTLLLPLLKKTTVNHKTDIRIVVTSSSLHCLCRRLDLNLLKSPTPTRPAYFDGIWRYGRSKLGGILFTRELSRRLLSDPDPTSKNIYVNAFFPGNIATEQADVWKKYFGSLLGWLIKKFLSIFGQSTEDAAATAMYLAASKEISNGVGTHGEYFIPIATKCRTTSIAEDMLLARSLWVRESVCHLSDSCLKSSSAFFIDC